MAQEEGGPRFAGPQGPGAPQGHAHTDIPVKPLKVRTVVKEDPGNSARGQGRSPRRSADQGAAGQYPPAYAPQHGAPQGPQQCWLWRNSFTGGVPPGYPDSPKASYAPYHHGTDSGCCPSSPVAVPMTMAYPGAAPAGYVMFPVMIQGAPDSPRAGLTPLMGSPVGTPTAMMFPQTPFAQHNPNGPFAPPGPGMPNALRSAPSISGAPSGDQSHYFHPLFNGFSAFGGPGGQQMPPGMHGAYPMQPGSKGSRNSATGDKGRMYQPSPLKPGMRKSSASGGGHGMAPVLMARPGSVSMGSGPMPGGHGLPPQPPSAGVQRGYMPSHHHHQQQQHQQQASHRPASVSEVPDGADDGADVMSVAALQQHVTAAAEAMAAAANVAAASSAVNAQPSQEAIDATAAAAVVVAAVNAAAASLSGNPTPRSSMSGIPGGIPGMPPHRTSANGLPSVLPPPRTSASGIPSTIPSARTSCSGIGALPSVAAAAAAALSDEHSGGINDTNLDHDVSGMVGADVDIQSYGNGYGSPAGAGPMGAWGLYDPTGAGMGQHAMGGMQAWAGMMPAARMYAAPMMAGPGGMGMQGMQGQGQPGMQQPLLQAAMLQQLAAHMPSQAMGGYYQPAPAEQLAHAGNDYMAAAEHLAQLQALQGSLLAQQQQSLRAAAAAAAVAANAPDMHHHNAMAAGLGHAGLVNPALLAGAGLGGHHGAAHLQGLGGPNSGGRARRTPQPGAGSGAGSNTPGSNTPAGADGAARLNARQRRTLRRAKERAIRGLLEAGKLLVARTMGEGEGDDDGPSGGYDSDEGEDTGDLDAGDGDATPPRPLRRSLNGAAATLPRNSSTNGMAAVAASANPPRMSDSGVGHAASRLGAAPLGRSPLATHVGPTGSTGRSPSSSSSHSSAAYEATSSCGGAPSSFALTSSAPSSGKASPLSALPVPGGAEGAAAAAAPPADAAAAPAAPAPAEPIAINTDTESPAPSAKAAPTTPTPTPGKAARDLAREVTGSATPGAGSPGSRGGSALAAASSAMAALAAGNTSEADIAALIQQLNQKREEGLVDDKLMRDLEIINNLIGALKTSGPSTAPSYNAQGRKPAGGHHHHHHHAAHHHGHAAHTSPQHQHPMQQQAAYLAAMQRLSRNYNLGY